MKKKKCTFQVFLKYNINVDKALSIKQIRPHQPQSNDHMYVPALKVYIKNKHPSNCFKPSNDLLLIVSSTRA